MGVKTESRIGEHPSCSRKNNAVSPVVGIMLMLTVTLILAAIISGFTGGIAKSQSKPPQLLFEASMVHDTSTEANSFLDIRVISVSEGIQTRDLKLQTEWRNQSTQPNRRVIMPNSVNADGKTYPLGYGPGVQSGDGGSDFGNYTLLAGTRMNVNNSVPASMDAVLSDGWDDKSGGITDGTPIRIQLVHVPSGAIIADKEITAET
ncbi:MAG: type IV pilin N-terminal domain-containing protein [Methanospirillum sp.]|uniref:type IV pilin N-terminal domain-containing protein n=1 Tax=Methanospirillum sp. TaxID=45200 RepID=UPI00236EA88A|nr:type IV pilin N-terminal domain-containing protein [Methanospirillum sp.]MDD1728303.1 type IV pilin N-terminal domain-containing protein [Methanospirillum sp.]